MLAFPIIGMSMLLLICFFDEGKLLVLLVEVKIPQHLKHEDGNKRWFDTLAGPLLSGTILF